MPLGRRKVTPGAVDVFPAAGRDHHGPPGRIAQVDESRHPQGRRRPASKHSASGPCLQRPPPATRSKLFKASPYTKRCVSFRYSRISQRQAGNATHASLHDRRLVISA